MDERSGVLLEMLDSRQRAALMKMANVREFERAETLVREADGGGWVLVVLAGLVKASKLAANGREAILAVRGPGELLGEMSAIDHQPRSAGVTALTAGSAAMISRDDFWDLLGRNAAISRAVLVTMAQRLRTAGDHELELSTSEATGRVARRIVTLQAIQGGRMDISSPLTQQELAEWAGVSRDVVIRALTEMRSRGLIATSRQRFVVRNQVALEALAATG